MSSYREELDQKREIVVDNGYVTLKVRVSDIVTALETVWRRTGIRALVSAMEMMHFYAGSQQEKEHLGLLITLFRCWKDGNVKPPIDMDRVYGEIASQVGRS